MKRLLVAGGVAVVGILLLTAIGLRAFVEPADAFVDRWLHAVSGDGATDRGWSQLDEESRQRFGHDAKAYQRAAAAQDWSGFQWDVESWHELESWISYVYVRVDGGLTATPGFLRHNKLVAPYCLDDAAPGIGLQVFQEWPFSKRTLGSGTLAGSSERALATGVCPASPSADEQFQPGGEIVWTGHDLEVWNWTTLPLFLLDKGGHRVDLPPCTKVPLDGFAREFAVRAESGYVMTFGLDGPQEGRTTFVVIGSRDAFSDNARPGEPMPPCEGEPQVQVGF